MTTKPSQQSNPSSTGGLGGNFEIRIQASFAALMLMGGFAPALPRWPIQSIKLQGRYEDYGTDDCIVFVQNPQNRQQASKLIVQIKHVAHVTKQDPIFEAAIHAAWRDFCNPKLFSPDTDHIALITEPLSATDIENVRPILEWSRHCHSADEFFKKMKTPKFSSAEKCKKLDVFKHQLEQANENTPLNDDTFWRFLKCFHLIGYDFDTASGSSLSLIQTMLGLGLHDQSYANDVWNELLNVTQYANQNAGTISLTTLPATLVEKFKPLRFGVSTDFGKLKDHGELILASIQNKIGSTHIDRSDLLDQLISLAETSNFILINGARGLGKSALAKEFAEKMGQEYQVFCLRAEDLDKSHLDSVFHSIGIKSTLKELSAHFAMIPKKVLILESVEKILELNHRGAFTDLLQFLKQSSEWTVIATGRDYAYPQITFNYLQPENINWANLLLEPLSDQALKTIRQDNPNLAPLIENATLNKLLRIPFWAQLAVRATKSGAIFDDQSTEASFRNVVWQHVIAKEDDRANGMPQHRRQTFIGVAVKRAKAMIYAVSEQGFDSEALSKLEADNILVRDATRRFVSPAHDVLEDWALEEFIDTSYSQNGNDFADFITQVGNEPAIRRAFRLWLHRCLNDLEQCEELESLIVKALSNKAIPKHWQDEMMTALLKGAEPYRFLNPIKDKLFADNAELLKRFCFILRISCKTPNKQLMQLLQHAGGESAKTSASLFLSPQGLGWQAIIRCLYENRAKITDKQIAQFTAVLDEWGSQISIHEELPEPAREAGLLALHLLEMLKDSYREENTKKLLNVIIKVVQVIKEEFSQKIEKDVFCVKTTKHRNQPFYIRKLLPMALINGCTAYLCKHVPELIIKLAWHTWFINGDSGYHSSADVDRYFGLHEHREECNFFPASGLKGPFFHLLREHSGIGLNFIIGLCNRAAAKYAPSELDNEEPLFPLGFTPGVFKIDLILNDGTRIKQFCSHRLWSGYRGFSVLPDLLQSALMALENWLIETVETTETPEEFETLEWLIDYILRQSNSVLTTAVVTSVATGYSEKMGKAILPVLSVLDLFRWDMERMIQERGGNMPNWFSSDDPMQKIYTDERRKAALRPWRNEHLETLITRLQFTELREDIFKILDKFKNIVSELNIDEESINRYRFLQHRIDTRDWKAQAEAENNRIVFSSKELEPDLKEVQQKALADQAINSRFITLFLWSETVFKGEPLERDYFSNWADALVEAKALYELLKNADVSNLAMGRSSGIVNAAAIFLRDHAQELEKEDIAWCINIIIEAVLLNADSTNQMALADITGHDGSLAAAQILPIVFSLIDDKQDVFTLKKIIATAITHANVTTCKAAADGIRNYLWLRDADFAQNCLNGAIEYSRLRKREIEQQRYVHSKAWQSSSETPLVLTGSELSENWLMELREHIAAGECVVNSSDVSLTTHSTWYLLPPVLMIPDSSNKPEHIALFSKIIAILIESEKSSNDRSNKNYGHERMPHEFAIDFAKRLANYLFSVQEEDARQILDMVLTQIEDAVDLASSLLLNITFVAEQQNAFERYWLFWSWFAEALLPYAMEPKALYQHRSYYSYDSDVIRRLLFANIPWQGVDIEVQALKSGVESITAFVKKAGINPVVYAAITRLIYYFPMLFKPAVLIENLASFQVKQTDTYLLSEGDTVFYLERILHRFLVLDRKPQTLSYKLRRACLTLLDAMVETSSSQAYFLREHLLQLR